MDEQPFVWPSDLSLRFFKLRFKYESLFKKKKQAWREFAKIIQERHDFPKDITTNQLRKKWLYTYNAYKTAKNEKNVTWKYYRLFEKYFGKKKVLDTKFSSWDDEWRMKLIQCITETRELKYDNHSMWKTVECSLRTQGLPNQCCVQDLKGLWHHLKTTFGRKYRYKKYKEICDWPLYKPILDYFQKFDPEYLERLETNIKEIPRKSFHCKEESKLTKNEESSFQWTRDITESLIQIRLQHDWVFRETKWAWSKMRSILIEENGFPEILTKRDLCRKWSSLYNDYQKAKAKQNTSWLYYSLFELYLGDGSFTIDPLAGWQEDWIKNLITIRSGLENSFSRDKACNSHAWRKVERRLREMGLPADHSLLDLPEMWEYLLKTFRWKQKFSNQGVLVEQWPYFDQMSHYVNQIQKSQTFNHISQDYDDYNDYDDDMKLIDVKKLVKPKYEVLEANYCRSCANDEACISLFDQLDNNGVDLATKLRVIGGIQVEQSDSLPYNICLNCLQQLENAYKFRTQCQEADKDFREKLKNQNSVKIEIENIPNDDSHFDNDILDVPLEHETIKPDMAPVKKIKVRKKYPKYDYWKICEVCGKNTKNLATHMDSHNTDRQYSCDICEKTFKFKSGLSIHKASHDPTPKKTCEVCGKQFYILAQYRRHYQYHANERNFECDTCGKRFNSPDILRVHTRTHTDERPFSCSDCGKSFRTAGCVSRHRRIVHHVIRKALT